MDDQTYNDLTVLLQKGLEHNRTGQTWYTEAYYLKAIEDARRIDNEKLVAQLQAEWLKNVSPQT